MMAFAYFAEEVPCGDTQSSRMSGQVELPRMPSLCSSLPMVKPGVFLDEEGGEFFYIVRRWGLRGRRIWRRR